MNQEDKISSLRLNALDIQSTDPQKSLELLMALVEEHERSWSVANLVLDDIIGIAKRYGYWDTAILACQKAQVLKPHSKEHYVVEERSCNLDREGKHIEAIEVRAAYARQKGKSSTLDYFADELIKHGAHDKAWHLYNEAITTMAQEGYSTHGIRQSMAKSLLQQDKPDSAVETLITGICEAKDLTGSIPSTLKRDLKKALQMAGFNLHLKQFRGLADEIITICETQGQQSAVDSFYQRKTD
jgi:hypothetical protein